MQPLALAAPPCFSMKPYFLTLSDPFPFCDSGELQTELQTELLLILGAFLETNPPIIIPLLDHQAILPHKPVKLICPTQLRPPPAIGSKSPTLPGLE